MKGSRKDALHVIGTLRSPGGKAPVGMPCEPGEHRLSEEACRDILDSVNDGAYRIGPDGRFTYLNRTALARSGLTRENFRQCHYLDLVVPEQRDFVRDRFEKVMRGEENPPYDLRTKGRNGREYILEVKSRPLFEDGRVIGMLGISRDVTVRRKAEETILNAKALLEHMVEERTEELARQSARLEAEIGQRRLAEQKLRESETLYRAIFDNTGTAMMIVDEESTILLVNAGFEKLSGYTRPEAEGRLRWTDLLSEGTLPQKAPLPNGRRRPDFPAVRHYECQAVDKYGQIRDLFATVSEIPGTRQRIVSLQDVTERKQAVETIRRREQEMAVQNVELKELNTTLKVLLKNREEDRREIEEKIIHHIQELVLPLLAKLRRRSPGARELSLITAAESNLKAVITHSSQKLSPGLLHLTPKEIQVANLIRDGRTTKEIAENLDVSKSAIDTHRHHIRTKLGLKKKRVNLATYLHSLA